MPMFAKRHYEAVAKALKAAADEIRAKEPPIDHPYLLDGADYARDFLEEMFRRDNPKFDGDRFADAVKGH